MALPFPARPTQLDENWFLEREEWDIAVETRLGTLEDNAGIPGIAFDYDNYLFAIAVDGVAYAQTTAPVGSYGAWAGPDGTAIAIGANGTLAGAYGTIAIGDNVQADNDNALSIGTASESHAQNSTVVGPYAKAEKLGEYGGYGLVVVGAGVTGWGDRSVTIGNASETYGANGITIGDDIENVAERGIGIGSDFEIVGERGIGIGWQTDVTARAAIGIGPRARSYAPNSVTIGEMEQFGGGNTVRERGLVRVRDIEVKRPNLFTDEPEPTYAETDQSTGLILASPNGSRRRITIDDAGVISVEAIGAYDTMGWTTYGHGSSAGMVIAGSDDMTKLIMAGVSGNVRTSVDGGATWTARTGPGSSSWQDVASSADGTRLVIAGYTSQYIWTSANSGVNWTQRSTPGVGPWSNVVCSADGLTIYATSVFANDKFWKSADGGASWVKLSNTVALPRTQIHAVACSSDGQTLVVATRDLATSPAVVEVWKSTDAGTTWTEMTIYWESDSIMSNGIEGRSETFDGIAIDGAGVEVMAFSGMGRYFVSGSTTGSSTLSENRDGRRWSRVKMARNGTYAIAVTEESHLLWSDSGGYYWDYINGSGRSGGLSGWRDVAIAADGTKVAALDPGSQVYTKTYTL